MLCPRAPRSQDSVNILVGVGPHKSSVEGAGPCTGSEPCSSTSAVRVGDQPGGCLYSAQTQQSQERVTPSIPYVIRTRAAALVWIGEKRGRGCLDQPDKTSRKIGHRQPKRLEQAAVCEVWGRKSWGRLACVWMGGTRIWEEAGEDGESQVGPLEAAARSLGFI